MHKGLSQPQWAVFRSFKKGEESSLKKLLPKLKPTEIVPVLARMMMPIVSGMGGNAGAQSLTILVRSIAIGEFKFVRRRKAILKEAAVGACTGSITGLVMGLIAYLWFRNPWLTVAILLAMLGNLILGGFVGAAVPLLLAWRNKDPALGSSVLVTTATDVGGFFLFLGLATLLMHRLTMGN